jgi:hypothetical protein
VTKKTILSIMLALSISSYSAQADERDCSGAASSAVKNMDRFNPLDVDGISPIDDTNRDQIISILKKNGARASGMSPMQHQQLLLDLANKNPKYAYFVVQAGKQYFLSFTKMGSCAPFDPVRLN